MRRPPLHGLKILDFSRILAGPFCSMLLADMGAEVWKVEHVDRGDDTRSWGPPFARGSHESAYFLGVNRNKKSIAIDLKHPDGVQIARDLAQRADVVLENFIPGKADELGIGYSALSSLQPRLVYGSISGYGSSGPRAKQLAYDVMISAVGGLMGITGPEGGDPVKVGVAITDICAGLAMHGAILAALIAAQRDGVGQWIETSLLDTQIAALANVASAYLVSGVVTKPQGTAHVSIVPYQRFACSCGRSIIVGALNNSQFDSLCRAVAEEQLARDERFTSNAGRVKHRTVLIPLLEAALARRPAAEWLDVFEQHQVPCAPINDIKAVFEDKQVIHNKRVVTAEHPTVGLLKMTAPPATFWGTPLTTFAAPPLLGEHTWDILRSVAGYEEDRIASLAFSNVIHVNPRGVLTKNDTREEGK
jgi:succinate--hydroxymethylglutarate CoA-transferase